MRLPCWRVLFPVLTLALAATGGAAGAQQVQASVQGLAVIEEALVGSAVRDLEFGTLTPGVSQGVAPQNAQSCAGCASGLWELTGLSRANNAARRYISITYVSLPATLAGPAGATLTLNWTNAARGCVMRSGAELYCVTQTPSAGGTFSIPINGPTAPAAVEPNSGGRDMHLYLGGTASPTASQRAGVYTGTITVRMEYSSS